MLSIEWESDCFMLFLSLFFIIIMLLLLLLPFSLMHVWCMAAPVFLAATIIYHVFLFNM